MPRGDLTEEYVKRVAVAWLDSYYADQARVRAVHTETETRVVAGNKLGSGRADGLVASLMDDGTMYTASLEAKSARTLPNITLRYGDRRWLLHALVAGLLGMGAVGAIGWLFGGGWLLRWVLPPVAFFAVGFAYLVLTEQHARYHLIDVVQQVKRYPANEQWVAVSADAHNDLDDALQEALLAACRREGLGLLRVGSSSQVKPLEKPRPRTTPKGLDDFLACYARSDAIRQKLHARLPGTPPRATGGTQSPEPP